jgi:hypothetical protein
MKACLFEVPDFAAARSGRKPQKKPVFDMKKARRPIKTGANSSFIDSIYFAASHWKVAHGPV